LAAPSLGPLAAFTGTFRGSGFNIIFRPDSTPTPHHGTALHHGQGTPDPVLTAGLPELQHPHVAARLGSRARAEQPRPRPTLGLDLSK
jgi:hypothetical protein